MLLRNSNNEQQCELQSDHFKRFKPMRIAARRQPEALRKMYFQKALKENVFLKKTLKENVFLKKTPKENVFRESSQANVFRKNSQGKCILKKALKENVFPESSQGKCIKKELSGKKFSRKVLRKCILKRKCLFVLSVCAHFGLNAHSLCKCWPKCT